MRRVNPLALRQIRDRPRDPQGAVHRANGQAEARDGCFEKGEPGVIESTMLPKFLCREVRVAEPGRGRPSRRRAQPRRLDAPAHGRGVLAVARRAQLLPRQRPPSSRAGRCDRAAARRACARSGRARAVRSAQDAPRIAEEPAGARIHRGDEQHVARKDGGALRADDRDPALLERLADRLEHVAPELGQLVEKEDAPVGQRDFAGRRARAAADQPGARDAVVRRAEGRSRERPGAGRQRRRRPSGSA